MKYWKKLKTMVNIEAFATIEETKVCELSALVTSPVNR